MNLFPVFLALMKERSVTRAAQRLGMTQPALSNALGRLREMLQDPLFIRERYGMQPTEKAEALAPGIEAAVALLDEMVLGQQGFDAQKANRMFTLAPSSYVESVLLPGIVTELSKRAPGIRLRLVPFGADLGETGVVSGATAMVIGRIVDPPDNLVIQPLMEDGLACVVRADHPMVNRRMTKQKYEQLKHVNVLPPGRLRAGLFQTLERHGLRRDVAISVTHFSAIPELVAATDYCATLPRLICRLLARDARLKVLDAPVDLGSFPVEIAWHVRYRHDAAHQWLRELVAEVAARESIGGR